MSATDNEERQVKQEAANPQLSNNRECLSCLVHSAVCENVPKASLQRNIFNAEIRLMGRTRRDTGKSWEYLVTP